MAQDVGFRTLPYALQETLRLLGVTGGEGLEPSNLAVMAIAARDGDGVVPYEIGEALVPLGIRVNPSVADAPAIAFKDPTRLRIVRGRPRLRRRPVRGDPARRGTRARSGQVSATDRASRTRHGRAQPRPRPGAHRPSAGARLPASERLLRDADPGGGELRRGRRPVSESPATRAKVDPEAIAAKVAHLAQERDSRLADLEHRYRARVSVRIASIVALHIPTALVSVHVRRRKREGPLFLRLPAGAKRFDRLPCAAGDGWLSSPVLCDDQLHTLCEWCAPDAGGGLRCGACGR